MRDIPSRFASAIDENRSSYRFLKSQFKGMTEPSQAQLESLGRFLLVGDPLADRAVRSLLDENGLEEGRQALKTFLRGGGWDGVGFPALTPLIEEVQREPLWLERELLTVGENACQRAGVTGLLVLRNYALLGGYISGAVNKPLVFTGVLNKSVQERLQDTSLFWLHVTRRDELAFGGQGFRDAILVRFLHALTRLRLCEDPRWKTGVWGVPINQADMLATQLAFSVAFIRGVRKLGVDLAQEERLGILHLWRYVGVLMGIEPSLLPATEEEGAKFLYAIVITQPEPDEDSMLLAHSLIDESIERFAQKPPWVGRLEQSVHLGVAHALLGAGPAATLQLPQTIPWYPVALRSWHTMTNLGRKALPWIDRWLISLGDQRQKSLVRPHKMKQQPLYARNTD